MKEPVAWALQKQGKCKHGEVNKRAGWHKAQTISKKDV